MNGFILYLIIMNALGFLLMREDKQRAVEKRYRIPESTLLLISALGGSLGGYLGMRVCHHKTRRLKFRWGLPALLLIHTALIAAMLLRDGSFFLPGT